MNKKPLVSIIMNCLNGEEFLNHAVKSILNQTYKNWELFFGIINRLINLQKY